MSVLIIKNGFIAYTNFHYFYEVILEITLRKARLEDSEMVLSWRNEPGTIPWMGTTRALSFEEHHDWFVKTLLDENSLFFIIEFDSDPIGQIRYHQSTTWIKNAAKVSINITQKMHGKGIASIAFKKGSELVRALGFAHNIFAYVRLDNIGSIKAMENAGYKRGSITEVHDIEHLMMEDCIG